MFPGLATADDAWKVGQPPFPAYEVQVQKFFPLYRLFMAVAALFSITTILIVIFLSSFQDALFIFIRT